MLRAEYRGILAVVTVAALVIGVSPGPALAKEDTGALKGRIFAPASRTPLQGATVKAAHLPSETIFESAPSDEAGRFSLADLPSGSYELAVATDEGLFPTRQTFLIEGGETRVLALALALADDEDPEEGEEGTEEAVPAVEEEDDDDEAVSFWDRTYVATFTIIGFATALGFAADKILDDSQQPKEIFSSASQP